MRLILVIVCILILSVSFGQYSNSKKNDEPAFRTIFSKKGGEHWTFQVGPEIKSMSSNGKKGLLWQARFGMIINKQYGVSHEIGFLLSHVTYKIPEKFHNDTLLRFRNRYANVVLEYIFFKDSPFHLTTGAAFGGGSMQFDWDVQNNNPSGGGSTQVDSTRKYVYSLDYSSFLSSEISVTPEITLGPAIRLGFGVGYRWIFDANLKYFDPMDFSGMYFRFSLKFGKFT